MSETIFSTFELRIRAVEATQRGVSRQNVAAAYGINGQVSSTGHTVG